MDKSYVDEYEDNIYIFYNNLKYIYIYIYILHVKI